MKQAKTIMVVSAHPDDVEFGAGGSVAIWADEGWDVHLVIVTDGSTGTEDAGLFGKSLADIRREETLKAAEILGISDVKFLGYPDGYVEATLELRKDIAREFRRIKPHRLLAMDPVPLPAGWFINHPDHRAVGQATLDITVTAGTTVGHFPELVEEGFDVWRGLMEIFVMGPAGGEEVVDISNGIGRKIDALLAHNSQVSGWDVATRMREWTADLGKDHGFAHAESFHKLVPMGAPAEEDQS